MSDDLDEVEQFFANQEQEKPKPKYYKWQKWSAEQLLRIATKALTSFVMFRQLDGIQHVFYAEDNGEVTRVLQVEQTLEHQVGRHLKAATGEAPPIPLVERVVEVWLNQQISIAGMPKPFLFANEEGYTYKKLEFTVDSPAPFPAWEEFLGRLSDRDAFMAFVWSCFDAQSQARQYMWLKGEGQDGKSVVLRVISDVFGNAAGSLNDQHLSKGNQFLFSTIFGKRVLIYGDCKNAKFGMKEITRNITGRDAVTIEFKGQLPFSSTVYSKLFVASNYAPEITGIGADTSRILYMKVSSSAVKDDPLWENKLRSELPGFLYACKEVYSRICPHHGNIRVSQVSVDLTTEAAAGHEDEYVDVFGKYFEFDKAGYVMGSALRTLTRIDLGAPHKLTSFREWLGRHGVERKHTVGGTVYSGMKLKGYAQQASNAEND